MVKKRKIKKSVLVAISIVAFFIIYGLAFYAGTYLDNKDKPKVESKEDEEIINWAIEKTGLKNLKSKAVMSLSGGERQRVFIAMALAQKSEILFLDEPTTYLDIYHQVEVLELVKKLNKEENLTVLMVLHDINQALKYSDNIIIMKKGKIIESGKSEKVINMNLLKEVYNIGGYITDYNKEKVFIPLKL